MMQSLRQRQLVGKDNEIDVTRVAPPLMPGLADRATRSS